MGDVVKVAYIVNNIFFGGWSLFMLYSLSKLFGEDSPIYLPLYNFQTIDGHTHARAYTRARTHTHIDRNHRPRLHNNLLLYLSKATFSIKPWHWGIGGMADRGT